MCTEDGICRNRSGTRSMVRTKNRYSGCFLLGRWKTLTQMATTVPMMVSASFPRVCSTGELTLGKATMVLISTMATRDASLDFLMITVL